MKKIITLFLVMLCCSIYLKAQTTGGPDGYGYIWRDSNDSLGPVYNWVDIVGLPGATEVKSLADDNTAGPFPLGFTFRYYYYNRTTFRIGSNGFIIFNNGANNAPFPPIPLDVVVNGTNPQDYIAAMASDLTFVEGSGAGIAGAECWFYVSPTLDSLVVSWINLPFWDGAAVGNYTGSNTFQMILATADSSITFQYQQQNGVYQNTLDFMTIGIENVSGALGLQHSHDVYPQINYAIKFFYPSNSTYQVSDASAVYNDNESSGGLFISHGGDSMDLVTNIENTGNQTLNPFNVTSQILNPGQVVVYSSTVQTDTLQPGQSQLITHPAKYAPAFPGNYTFNTSTQLINDLVASNNIKVLELRALDTTTSSMTLQYENLTVSSAQALSWTGGNGGGGYYFKPPFYPVTIDTLHAFIVSNATSANFFMELYDDDGPFETPGTRLDSQQVFNPLPAVGGQWYSIALPNPITVDSGGFYLSWNMDGDNIQLGTDISVPYSFRTYEVLGNVWSVYRFRESQDLMIRASISNPNYGVGISNATTSENQFGDFYPNPANDQAQIKFTLGNGVREVSYSVFDMTGREILSGQSNLKKAIQGTISIPTVSLRPGLYNCRFHIDGKPLNRRFMISR